MLGLALFHYNGTILLLDLKVDSSVHCTMTVTFPSTRLDWHPVGGFKLVSPSFSRPTLGSSELTPFGGRN